MPPSGARWPVRHGLGLSFSDFVQVRLPVRLVLMEGPGDCRGLLLSHLRLSLSQLGLGLFGLRLRPVPGVLAQDPPPGLGASFERTCSALDRDAAGQPGAVRKRPHACDSYDHTVLPGGLGEIASTIAGCDQEGKDKRSPAARAFVAGPLISRRCAGPAAARSRAGPARRAAACPHGPDRRPADSPR